MYYTYRIKVMSAGGKGLDSVTMKQSPNKITVRKWGEIARKNYPNHSIVVQRKDNISGEFHDFRLIEDF